MRFSCCEFFLLSYNYFMSLFCSFSRSLIFFSYCFFNYYSNLTIFCVLSEVGCFGAEAFYTLDCYPTLDGLTSFISSYLVDSFLRRYLLRYFCLAKTISFIIGAKTLSLFGCISLILTYFKGLKPNISVKSFKHWFLQAQCFGEVDCATAGLLFYIFPSMTIVVSQGQKYWMIQLSAISSQLFFLRICFFISFISQISAQYSQKKCLLTKAKLRPVLKQSFSLFLPYSKFFSRVNQQKRAPQVTMGATFPIAFFLHTSKPFISYLQSTIISSSIEKKTSDFVYLGILQRQYIALYGVRQKQIGIFQLALSSKIPISYIDFQLFQMMLIQLMIGQSIQAQRLRQLINWELSPARACVTVIKPKLRQEKSTSWGPEALQQLKSQRKVIFLMQASSYASLFYNYNLIYLIYKSFRSIILYIL